MKKITIDELESAIAILQNGGVLIFPTETSYGLGCDATNKEAVEKIFTLKGRPALVWPFPVIVADLEMAKKYVQFSPRALELANKFWPGPLNIVLPVSGHLSTKSVDDFQSVRISAHPVASELVKLLGRPLVATSANLSGQPALYDLTDLEVAFGDKLAMIDGVIDVGPLPESPASTTVKVIGDEVQVLRQGSIVI